MADLQKLVVRLEAETARYARELDAARRKTTQFERSVGSSVDRIGKSFKSGLAALGITSFVTGLTLATKRTLDWADSMVEAAGAVGLSTKKYQELTFATSQAGIKQEQFTASFSKFVQFAQSAAQGDKGPAALFGRLGIDAKESIDDIEGLFDEVVSGLSLIPTQAEKLSIIGDLFGAKVAAKWASTLGEGADGIDKMAAAADRLGLIIDQKDIEALGRLGDEVDAIGTKFQVAFAKGLAEGLTGETGELRDIMSDPAFAAAVDNLAAGFKSIGREIGELPALLSALQEHIPLLKILAAAAAGTAAFGPLGGAAFAIGEAGFQGASSLTGAAAGLAKRNRDSLANDSMFDDGGSATGGMVSDSMFESSPLQKLGLTANQAAAAEAAAKKTAAAARAVTDAITSSIQSLEQEAATLGMTSAQQQLYELRLEGATAAQLAHAQALVTTIGNYELQEEAKSDLAAEDERLTQMSREYMGILDDLDGGTRAYGDALAELDVLVKAGNISLEQRTQIAGELEKQMKGLKDASDFAADAYESIRGSTKDLFSDLLTDGKNWKDHLLGYLEDIGDAFADMAADIATQALFGGQNQSGGGFDWGGLVGGLIGAIGGSFGTGGGSFGGDIGTSLANTGISFNADGGTFSGWSVVGERGPELVYSHTPSRVFSNEDSAAMLSGGGQPNVTFNVTTPNADSFRASEKQMVRRARAELRI